jgi:hypothetical protein
VWDVEDVEVAMAIWIDVGMHKSIKEIIVSFQPRFLLRC